MIRRNGDRRGARGADCQSAAFWAGWQPAPLFAMELRPDRPRGSDLCPLPHTSSLRGCGLNKLFRLEGV